MRRPSRSASLVPALLGAATLLAGCGGVNRRDYVSRNEAILASLPVFPGAVKTHELSTPDYGHGEFSDPTGYSTSVDYRVPRGTRGAAVLRFYESRLERRGWRVSFSSGAVRNFTRKGSLVALDAILLSPAHGKPLNWTYELDVDQRGG